MKLISVRVTNYRSIDDSEEFAIDDITCLVGKNESGKTAILKAIEGIKPFDSKMGYDKTIDYPRRYLNEYDEKHGQSPASICISEWKLESQDITALEEEFGHGCLISKTILVTSYYERGKTWDIKLNEKNIVDYLCNKKNLDAAEQAVAKQCGTTQALYNKIKESTIQSEKLDSIKTHIKEYRKQNAVLAAIDILSGRMPSFVYFSHYSRMSGEVSINQYREDVNDDNVSDGDKVFSDFLSFAGTNIDEIEDANTHEEFKSKIESASNNITEQIFEYWTQNQYLEIEFDVGAGRPGDRAPFNSGTVMRARVKNTLHKASVPFSERSAGFIWFFSFLVHFSQVKKHYLNNEEANVIVLLDEPGLTLHAKAQYDLLEYIQKELAPNHQVIYTTHSPFMIISDQLESIRTVEDVLENDPKKQRPVVRGTKVSSDFLKTSKDTIFPLQSALGYEISQTLFIGKKVILVEGPSDILYLKTISNVLKEKGRAHLGEWVLCPAGSIDKIAPFINLYLAHGEKREIIALTDYQKGHKSKVQRLRNPDTKTTLLLYSDFCDKEEADVEDVFEKSLYLEIFSQSCGKNIDPAKIDDKKRITKEIDLQVDDYSHYQPADWLMRNSDLLRENDDGVNATLAKFENIFQKINENN